MQRRGHMEVGRKSEDAVRSLTDPQVGPHQEGAVHTERGEKQTPTPGNPHKEDEFL